MLSGPPRRLSTNVKIRTLSENEFSLPSSSHVLCNCSSGSWNKIMDSRKHTANEDLFNILAEDGTDGGTDLSTYIEKYVGVKASN